MSADGYSLTPEAPGAHSAPGHRSKVLEKATNMILSEAAAGSVSLSPEERAALERMREIHQSALTKVGRLAGSGRMNRAQVEVAFNQTRLMGRGASRIILEMLFEKAALGKACPYDSKVLLALAKGFGIVSPSKPVDDADRAKQTASLARIKQMTDSELSEDVLGMVRQTREQADAEADKPKRR